MKLVNLKCFVFRLCIRMHNTPQNLRLGEVSMGGTKASIKREPTHCDAVRLEVLTE